MTLFQRVIITAFVVEFFIYSYWALTGNKLVAWVAAAFGFVWLMMIVWGL